MKNYKEIKQLAEEAKKKEKDEQKFCRLCQKPETRDECSYGEKAWDRFAVPIKSVKKEEADLSDHFELEEGAAWTRKAGQNKNGGLNEKGRKSYEKLILEATSRHLQRRLEIPAGRHFVQE